MKYNATACLFSLHSHLRLYDRKTASLGEMIQQLKPLGVDVPGGFGVSSAAYDAVLNQSHLRDRLDAVLKGLDVTDLEHLAEVGKQCRQMIMNAGLPEYVRKAVEASYNQMCSEDKSQCSVAVR
ncbi:MAG: hypothetical protein SGARI_007769, partial [Bacillariaceae sp.]